MSRERLTIDLTVARDYLAVDDERRRERHEQAVLLFALFRAGEVELAIAPQGHRLDAEGDLAEQLRAMLVDEGVEEAPQLAYVSEVTYPAETFTPVSASMASLTPGTTSSRLGGLTRESRRNSPIASTSRRTCWKGETFS